MSSLVLTIRETLRYRGAIGQWSWVLHRLTGLGVVLFLFLHVIDTSWAVFAPASYEKAIAAYQSPLFTIGEFGLVFAVVYHAFNGFRIAFFDFRPELWKYQQRAAYYVLIATAIVLVPMFVLMFSHVVHFYGGTQDYMPVIDSIVEQWPFLGFFVAGAALAVVAAGIHGALTGNRQPENGGVNKGSAVEKFWWSFMRVSGVLIIPLVFGHLAAMHVVQGVFDITLQGTERPVIGTIPAPVEEGAELEVVIGDGWNATGTATEFVAERWGFLVGGVAVWRLYDAALLTLVVLHGFNGLRYVLTDYTMQNVFARRTATYLTVIGGAALLLVGIAALLGSIETDSLTMAQEALRDLRADW